MLSGLLLLRQAFENGVKQMEEYTKVFLEEEEYLEHTVNEIRNQLRGEQQQLAARKKGLARSRREMWEDTGAFPSDFAGVAEISQYRSEVIVQTETYLGNLARVEKYKRMADNPYFGRFDFLEEGEKAKEKIYVGLGTLIDSQSFKTLVYDWRAPVCSVFYRHELGPAEYEAPSGILKGEVLLKRQYKVRKGKLLHFFDSNIVIRDEMLQDILSRNASTQMRTIVESIQKEQDIVIRDEDHGLVIVQGAAGSGKTSIALHRVAFLLYEGLGSNLNARNVIIISPNQIFSRYIATVLPDLGEENVEQITFDSIAGEELGGLCLETRAQQLERVMEKDNRLALKSIEFKGSALFVKILDRLLWHYEHKMIPFEDVYYHGKVIASRQLLKSRFLVQRNTAIALRLEHIEESIWEAIKTLRQERLKRLEEIVQGMEGRDLEIKSFSRYLSLQETRALRERLHKFTKIDYRKVYQELFDKGLFFKLAGKEALPDEIGQILEETRQRLQQGIVQYEDIPALMYLKLKIEGADKFPWIKHVVVDEAQDYTPLQYEVFKKLFRWADFTVLGDVNQSMERGAEMSLYDDIVRILDKKEAFKLVLTKTYRSSYEISQFTQGLLGQKPLTGAFERHDAAPRVLGFDSEPLMLQAIARQAGDYLKEGFESVAIICKTAASARRVYHNLHQRMTLNLIEPNSNSFEKGITVIPVYMAKGLEFDAVLVYETNKEHFFTEFDRRLLYIACTRALHRLDLYFTGEKSPFLS